MCFVVLSSFLLRKMATSCMGTRRWGPDGARATDVQISLRCKVPAARLALHRQQSTHSDNTRASCPLVAIETQIQKARILNAHEGEVGVVSSPLERAAVRVPKSEHDTYQMLYTSRHGFCSRKGFEILVYATDVSKHALAATERSREPSRCCRNGKLNTRFSEWVERYLHGPYALIE